MAYVSEPTRSTGDLVTASIWNQGVGLNAAAFFTGLTDTTPVGGATHKFGGSHVDTLPTAVPTGATIDKIAAGTDAWLIDSAKLTAASYALEIVAISDNALDVITAILVNLDDGAPNTALTGSSAATSGTAVTGQRVRSGTITLPTGGTAKQLAVKASNGNAAYNGRLLAASLIRTG